MAEIIIGIDLGTTNSEVAIVQDGKPRVLAVDGDPILPSVVGLGDDGKLLVGKAARNQYVLAPERTIKSVKRKMGQDVKVSLGEQQFRPQEVSAMILRRLKEAAEKELGQPVQKAVITVPAYFNDTQRQATREAGQLAGLDVVRIINEPTAAALTYTPDPAASEKFLVYDLGGGTFDVSILQAESGVFEVLASHGDTQLGGDDFDELLLNSIADDFQEAFQIDLRENRVARARLLRSVEAAKRHLSDHPFAKIEEEFIAEKDGVPLHLSQEVTREEFETLIAPLIARTMDCVQKSLDDAKMTASQLKQVVLVGGSTRTPMIGRILESRLGQPAHREVHPDLCVAMGAAIQAAIIAGQNVGAVLVDLTPHSMGIRCLEMPEEFSMSVNEHKFATIIARNTPLPASRSEMFCTVSDNQSTVEVDIFQGESGDVRRNHRVGKFLVEGLAKVPAGNQLVVQLDLNLDGTLKVSAREKSTGMVKQISIQNAMARFALEERDAAKARLDRLWANPDWNEDDIEDAKLDLPDFGASDGDIPFDDEEDDEGFGASETFDDEEEAPKPAPRFNTAAASSSSSDDGHRETVQARALLEKTDRVREKASAEDKLELDRLSDGVRTAMQSRNWPSLTKACNDLADVLFYLEDA
jgi:molecular chaperone DnaK